MNRRDTYEVACSCQDKSLEYEYVISEKLPEGVLRPGGLRLTKRLVDVCAFLHAAKVVDIGCGTGITVEYLRDICGVCAVGIDISEARLRQGRERTPDLQLMRAEGEDLPFGNNSVDGVLAECSLSVMQDAHRVLKEIHRILIPGGKLAITDMYVRHRGSTSLACNEAGAGCRSGIMTYGELAEILGKQGFSLIVWEEQSVFLKEFVARFIMEHGSAEELWRCLATRQHDQQFSRSTVRNGLGYFLLVAEKRLITSHHSDGINIYPREDRII